MDEDAFRHSPCGRLVPTTGGAWAFVPAPLPPRLDLGPLVDPIAEASTCLGELRGIGTHVRNPYLLVSPLQRKEAVASSSIEGTYSSLSELFAFEAGIENAARRDDQREVANYVVALHHALDRLAELPVCNRLICEMHRDLLRGLPPQRRHGEPGQFKTDQNWIAGSKTDIAKARFVPPPPDEARRAMSDLEKFINDIERPHIQPLVLLALIHYQFETIHPFADGNGRVGRALIPVFLQAKALLPQPLLYMSPFFEIHKDEYIDRMFEVSRNGDWNGWIEFFLRGVIDSSRSAVHMIRQLDDLRIQYVETLRRIRAASTAHHLLEILFERPVISIPGVQNTLGVTYRAARQNVDRLLEEGILEEYPDVPRPKLFMAKGILDILTRETV